LNNLASLVTEGFLLLVVTATFFIVDPVAAVFALAYFGVVIVIIQVFIGRSLKRAGREAVDGTVETINSISNTLDSFREISVFHKQAHFIGSITTSRARIARSGATMTFLAGMPRYVVETALILGVVILVGYQFLSNQLGSGLVTVGVFLTGGVRMMASLLPLQSAVSNVKANSEQAAASLDLLTQIREKDAADSARVPSGDVSAEVAQNGLDLRLDAVTYRYPGNDVDTVTGVALEVSPGQYAAIIGPSGAGKTTIVDLILGLIAPDNGEVHIGGVTPALLRAAHPGLIAYVPQKPGLVSGTIAENIALGIDKALIDQESLERAVDSAYLREFIDSLPDGLTTSVGKQADSLSGGQIQRIGIARALYSKPRFIVLDEATSGLDASSEAFISASLRALHGSVTVVVIAHRLSTVQHADVVYVVEDGRITASGDFRTVQSTVPMVAEYVKLMSFDSNPDTNDADTVAESDAEIEDLE
jgi:ATP-binding cassette subfamily C protein